MSEYVCESIPAQLWGIAPPPLTPPRLPLDSAPSSTSHLPVVAVQVSYCSWCIELTVQLAGALAAGQAASIMQEEARGAVAARATGASALYSRVLCQAQLRARTPFLVTLFC